MAIPLFVLQNERNRVYQTRKLIDKISSFQIEQLTGLPPWGLREIIEVFEPLSGQTKAAIPIETKVLCFLHHLRSGSFQYSLGASVGISQPSVSRIINDCLNYTIRKAGRVINFPSTVEAINQVKQSFFFYNQFPNILGVVDGTQIEIKAPHENESIFVCRKQFHSINTQVITGPDLTILDIVAKWPGSTHDSFIYNHCGAKGRIEGGEFGDGWLLGKLATLVLIINLGMPTNLNAKLI